MKICSMDKKQREINMRSGKRNESMERYVVLIIFEFFTIQNSASTQLLISKSALFIYIVSVAGF